MTPDTALLERILWSQVERPLQGRLPEWRPDSAAALAIRGVLVAPALAGEEEAIVARWDGALESSKKLFDRLLQARVNRAVKEGLRVAAEELDLSELPLAPKVLIVREGEGPALTQENGKRPAANAHNSVVEFLSDAGQDVAGLEPGAKLDQLVDLLVLANQDGAESLRATLGPAASVVRPEGTAEAGPQVDLLLAAHSPSIQVFDIERELARLEEVLRNAIPAERRPAKSSTWSFGQDLTGDLLGGKYRVRGLKGKGAFKTVYEGEDEMLGARVAVAVLNPKGARSPRALQHFQDEAKKLTTLDHENIVRWITFDRTGEGLNYFVMEYLDGEELEVVLRREGRLAPKRVAAILFQVVAALRRAHGGGKHGALLHLDLKPENVFVLPALVPGEPERVKVIDFGIGQHVGAEVRAAERPELRTLYDLPAEELGKSIGSIALPEDDEPEEGEAGDARLESEAGPDAASTPADKHTPVRRRVQRARGGTLLYASPEQCKHLAGHKDIEALDGRSDLYSLGVMAFRMLTGQFPFARITTAYEAIQNHLEVAPRKVGSLGIKIPRELAAFVDRCLVKERAKRWRDTNEAHEALRRIVQPRRSALKISAPFVLVGAVGLGA
ncbi:MAG: serine/threonine protein kinase, partial [Planctomycetes bacterium]|nr:serine/threonine protein kinase [Planctomycetota bacterium]